MRVIFPLLRIVSWPPPPSIPVAAAWAVTLVSLAAVPETSAIEKPLKLRAAETLSSAVTPVASAVERRRMSPSLSIVSSPKSPSIPRAAAWAVTLLSPTASPEISAWAFPLMARTEVKFRPAATPVAVESASSLTMSPVLMIVSSPSPASMPVAMEFAVTVALLTASPEALTFASPLNDKPAVALRAAATPVASDFAKIETMSPSLMIVSWPSPASRPMANASAVTLVSLSAAPVMSPSVSPLKARDPAISKEAATPVARESASSLTSSPRLMISSFPFPPSMEVVVAWAVTLASLTAAPETSTFASPWMASPAATFRAAATPVASDLAWSRLKLPSLRMVSLSSPPSIPVASA